MGIRHPLTNVFSGALGIMSLLSATMHHSRAADKNHLPPPAAHTAAAYVKQQLDAGKKTNRLINEKSPYLLQHAFNPVDWHPWNEAAFALARKLNKPIFLSIGYSTCHWCHVMAHESFENHEIAALLNQHFICIKVDREERPDIDQIYMTAAQALTGRGGWPLSIFLTPDLKPFYAGTYFPPQRQQGLPAFSDILLSIHQAWQDKQEKVVEAAEQLTAHLQAVPSPKANGQQLDNSITNKALDNLIATFDEQNGGFGNAPKFPRPVVFNFLLRQYDQTGAKKALEMTTHTLDNMAAGGLYDHLGGGFHRYSTDDQWLVPHFEKMLYDQAQLAIAYLERFQINEKTRYAQIARETLDYVLRDMTSPQGGFYSAEDADSPVPANPANKAEGAFYLWHKAEIDQLLDDKTARVFHFHYNTKEAGNIELDLHSEFGSGNILHLTGSLKKTADRFDLSENETAELLQDARQTLFTARDKRPRPHLDDKVLTAWNGLMISAMAKGFQVLGEPRYLMAARQAASFILQNLWEPIPKKLRHRYRDGTAGLEAHLTDYAFLSQGLLDLYTAAPDIRWLNEAAILTERMLELFWDPRNHGFFDTAAGNPNRIVRMKSEYEGAEPNGNSVATLNLLRLSQMLNHQEWQEKAQLTIESVAHLMNKQPEIMPQMLSTLILQLANSSQIVVAGEPAAADTRAMLQEIHRRFLPNTVILLADGGEGQQTLAARLPFMQDLKPLEGKATAYLCENYTCSLPINDPHILAHQLSAKTRQ